MTYYHLKSATMAPSSPSAESYDAARSTWLCQGCGLPRVGTGAVDVHLDAGPERIPLSFVNGLGVGIIHRDLLKTFGADVAAKNLDLGDVFGPGGKRLTEFASFRGKVMVVIRGNKSSSHRCCGTCGRHIYFPMGKQYLLGPIVSGFDLAESQFNQLVVSEHIYHRVKSIKWRKMIVDKLAVQDRPTDGYDCPTEVEN